MGWIIYNDAERVTDPQAECARLVTWDSAESAGRVIADALVGNTYYAAHARTDKATGETTTLCVVLLIQRRPFGYKDMDETAGPTESDCPLHVLKALPALPARAATTCTSCKGSGKLSGEGIRPEYHGDPCYSCHGAGDRDRFDYARAWRKRCWQRFGGEPQGAQLAMAFAA